MLGHALVEPAHIVVIQLYPFFSPNDQIFRPVFMLNALRYAILAFAEIWTNILQICPGYLDHHPVCVDVSTCDSEDAQA